MAVATLGGVGYLPIMPGTWGTLATVPLYLATMAAGSLWVYLAVLLAVAQIGIASAGAAERVLGRGDPGPVVIDEAAGFLVAMFYVPVTVFTVSVGFFLFRFFDVAKIYPANRLERHAGGFGIVADDLISGLYANVALQVGLRLLPHAA